MAGGFGGRGSAPSERADDVQPWVEQAERVGDAGQHDGAISRINPFAAVSSSLARAKREVAISQAKAVSSDTMLGAAGLLAVTGMIMPATSMPDSSGGCRSREDLPMQSLSWMVSRGHGW